MYTEDKAGVPMVGRAMMILNYLSEKESCVGISEIAKDLSLPKATVFRILNTLEEWNTVECVENEGYRLGHFLIKLGRSASKNVHLIDICRPYMEAITKETDENVNLGIEYENAMLSIYTTYAKNSVLSAKNIPISPLYCSAIGKVTLAHFNEEQLSAYFSRHDIRKRTNKTIVTKEAFEKEKVNILKDGVAYDDEEYEEGLYCIAAPIFNAEGSVIASMSVSGVASRVRPKKERIENMLKNVSNQIGHFTEGMDKFYL